MKELIGTAKNLLSIFHKTKIAYRNLQRHLNAMPVGFPSTLSGIELRLLQDIFTVEEAEAAVYLDHRFNTLETIQTRAREKGYTQEQLTALLHSMGQKGSILIRIRNKTIQYALHPFVLGIYEMQFSHLSPGFYLDFQKYSLKKFAFEYLAPAIPQMRVVPIQKSITKELAIATYDEIRALVDQSKNNILIADCICKKGKDGIGYPCKVTDRREVCFFLGDWYNAGIRNNWGRKISKKEVMNILDLNEKEGLVQMPSNMQYPQVICSCCHCCCSPLEAIKMAPRSVDFIASNYYAELDPIKCNGCRICMKRCQMDAIQFDVKNKKVIAISSNKCIGCGLCVSTCKSNALRLKKKEKECVPPKDHDELYDYIMKNKKSEIGKIWKLTKAFLGIKI